MSSPPVPDPYVALGIAKDATSAQIKTTYRKLALKFHPDKVTDESQKATAADNFHRIQQAYEILGDEERRAKYDASVKLAELRREVLQKQQHQPMPQAYQPHNVQNFTHQPRHAASQPRPASRPPPSPVRPDVRTTEYKVPLASPRVSVSYAVRPERYDSSRPTSFDDDYFDFPSSRPSSRKQSYAEKEPRKHLSRSESERKIYVKEAEKSSRHDRRRTVDKDRRRDRESKRVPHVDDNSDSDTIEIPAPRRRDRDRESRHSRKYASSDSEGYADEQSRRRTQDSRISSAQEYMASRSKPKDDRRSAPLRNPTVDTIRTDYENVRRSSARSPPKDSSYRKEYERQRQYSDPQVTFRNLEPFSRPGLDKTHSSPLERAPTDRRSKTLNTPKSNHYDVPPMKRAETMPSVSVRRPEPPSRSESKLRQTAEMHYGLPTPSTSPPHEPFTNPKSSSRSKSYVIENDRTREISPRTTDRHLTRSPSPVAEKQDHKSRSRSTRRKQPTAPDVPPPVPELRIDTSSSAYGSKAGQMFDSPMSAAPRPPLSRENSLPVLLDDYMSPPSRRRMSLDPKDDQEVLHYVQDFQPAPKTRARDAGESRSSSRRTSTRPAPLKRSQTLSGMGGFLAAIRG